MAGLAHSREIGWEVSEHQGASNGLEGIPEPASVPLFSLRSPTVLRAIRSIIGRRYVCGEQITREVKWEERGLSTE